MKFEIKNVPVSRKVLLHEADNCYANLADKPELGGQAIAEVYITEFKNVITSAEHFKSNNQIRKVKAAYTVLLNAKLKECQKWLKRGEYFLELVFKQRSHQLAEYPNYQNVKRDEILTLDALSSAGAPPQAQAS